MDEQVGHKNANPVTQMIWANTLILVLLAVPSLSVMLLFRRKLGYRTIQPWMLFIIFFVLAAAGSGPALLGTLSADINPARYITTLAAFGVAGLGIFWRWSAWQSIKRGERWHTKSRGISYLHTLVPMLSEHIVQRYVEPFICMFVGLVFLSVSTPFGAWLFFSGAALAVMETLIYDIQLNNMLDQLDGLVEAEVFQENQAFFQQAQPGAEAPQIEAMAGVSVGFSPELQQMVAQRKAAAAARTAAQGKPATPPAPPAITDQVAGLDADAPPLVVPADPPEPTAEVVSLEVEDVSPQAAPESELAQENRQ